MKTIILLLLSITSVAQTLEIRSENTYVIESDVIYQNINWNGTNAKLIIKEGSTLVVNALNVNNNGSVINNGTLIVKGWVDLNSIKEFTSKGTIYAQGLQNNTRVPMNICGLFDVKFMQLNSAGIISDCCTLIKVNNLDINIDNAFSGEVHVIINNNLNLNKVFSTDKNVTYSYNKRVNQPLLYGVATYFDNQRPKCDSPLPVRIDYFRVKNNQIIFRFVEVKEVDKIELEQSNNMQTWERLLILRDIKENTQYLKEIEQ